MDNRNEVRLHFEIQPKENEGAVTKLVLPASDMGMMEELCVDENGKLEMVEYVIKPVYLTRKEYDAIAENEWECW